MIKVSVIIPVYNGEKYIKSCLDSVLNQTLSEIEIIIINDGSKDDTQKILEQYREKYLDKIEIVSKENEGQGKARNIGIDLAKGEFVTFVDSDDTIDSNMLQKLYDEIKTKEVDLVICDYYEILNVKEGKRKAKTKLKEEINERKTNKCEKKAILQKTGDLKKDYIISVAGPCNKLIKTDILKKNNLRFLENAIYEDIAMIPLIALYTNKIAYVEEPLYNYYIRTGSTMRQTEFNNKLLSIYTVLETLEKGFQQSGLVEEYKEELEFIYIKHLLYAGSGRFLEYKQGIEQIPKIVEIIKTKYPNWKNNQYYKKQSKIFKLNCNVFYTNNKVIIKLFQRIKKYVKEKII